MLLNEIVRKSSPIAQMACLMLQRATDRFRQRGRAGVSRIVRLTGASAVSYLAALWVHPHTLPLLAPITALLVVQLTLHDMVRHGLDRVASVLLGVTIAIAFSAVVGLTWWSLALLIAVTLSVGQIVRLGPNLPEVPISAMLVLGVSAGTTHAFAATDRISETLIGAIVGICINFFLPPGVRTRDAGKAIERFSVDIASLVEKAANEISTGVSAEQARHWLHDARKFSDHTPAVDRALAHAEESRRLNVRAIGTPNSGPSLRFALDSLEHSSVAIRSMFRAISDGVLAHPGDDEPFGEELRASMSDVLTALAASISAYGILTHALITGAAVEQEAALLEALTKLRTERDDASQLLAALYLGDARLREVNVYVISTADRVLKELEISELKRRHDVLPPEKILLGMPARARVLSSRQRPLRPGIALIKSTRSLAERRFRVRRDVNIRK
jgi:hypothetical protein